MRRLYLVLGGVAALLGILGAAVPLLPTVPFLLLAAWCFGRSSPALERRLLEHPRLGPPIRAWRDHGAVGLRSKLGASVLLVASAAAGLLSDVPAAARPAPAIVAALVLVFLWTRPSPPVEREVDDGEEARE